MFLNVTVYIFGLKCVNKKTRGIRIEKYPFIKRFRPIQMNYLAQPPEPENIDILMSIYQTGLTFAEVTE